MYGNLKAEMARRDITKNNIADLLGLTRNGVYNKINGKSDFRGQEWFKIHQKYFPDMDLVYLMTLDESDT